MKIEENKSVEFRRDDMPVQVSKGSPAVATLKKAFTEDESTTSNAKFADGELSFARK